MKNLPIKSPAFQYLEKGFKEWLDILGYATETVYQLPIHVREFFYHLESNGITEVHQITTQIVKIYYKSLKQRSNKRQGGGLSNTYLNKHLQGLYKFMDYLRQTGRIELSDLNIRWEEPNSKAINPLTVLEVKELYSATDKHQADYKNETLGARDKAMLTVFYGCGLRRNEGYHLDLSDVNLDAKMIHVRKGKNYKERFVPLNQSNVKILEHYIYDYRPNLQKSKKVEALFLSMGGKRMQGQSLAVRLKLLQQRSDNLVLNQKDINLHLLRHSIATHLLEAGMSLENISQFLGHTSLESTQIYTHLIEQQDEL